MKGIPYLTRADESTSVLFEFREGGAERRLLRAGSYLRLEESIRGEWRAVQLDRVEVINCVEALLIDRMLLRHEIEKLKNLSARRMAEEISGRQR